MGNSIELLNLEQVIKLIKIIEDEVNKKDLEKEAITQKVKTLVKGLSLSEQETLKKYLS